MTCINVDVFGVDYVKLTLSPIHTCAVIDCGVLEDPANGRVTTLQGTTLNRIARYFCDRGFVTVGSNFRLCGSTSMWGGMAPTCRGKSSYLAVN